MQIKLELRTDFDGPASYEGLVKTVAEEIQRNFIPFGDQKDEENQYERRGREIVNRILMALDIENQDDH